MTATGDGSPGMLREDEAIDLLREEADEIPEAQGLRHFSHREGLTARSSELRGRPRPTVKRRSTARWPGNGEGQAEPRIGPIVGQ